MLRSMFSAGLIFLTIAVFGQEKTVNDPNAQTRQVASFSGIAASGAIELFVTQGPQKLVVSAADPDDLDKIVTEVKEGVLHIRFRDQKSWWSDQWNTTGRKFRAYISAEQIGYISQSGSGNIRIEGTLKSRALKMQVSGSGNISGDIATDNLTIRQSGSSNIKLTGVARQADFNCSGSGNITSPGLETEICEITISGSGNADITVNKELTAQMSGSGNIRYRGNGNLVSSTTSGSGRVRKI